MGYSDHIYEPFYSKIIGNLIDSYTHFIQNSSIRRDIQEEAMRFYNDLRANLGNLHMNYRKFFRRHEANIALLERMLEKSKNISS